MTLETLETLDDKKLRAVIVRAGELLKQRDRERKQKALAEARTILASAGLSLKGVTARDKGVKYCKHRALTGPPNVSADIGKEPGRES